MRKWLVLKIHGKSNPVLINADKVMCIVPKPDNELQSILTFIDNDQIIVDQPTGSIEVQLP